MSTQDFSGLREHLLARAALLRADVQAHREQLVEPSAATGNSFIAGAEGAVADADDERELALLRRARHELDDVEAALRRLDSGSFGDCEGCGAPIPLSRLEALPQARLCLECQSAAERRAGAS
ncbi:MAG: TraR/DksA family transcriptional regulator [Burkholderiaceae bacterium]